VLVTAHERVEAPKTLRIVASARETQRAFSMTGLNDLLDLYPSYDAALDDTRGPVRNGGGSRPITCISSRPR
jgi:hypothetical protein